MYKEYFSINGRLIPYITGGKGSKGCFAKGTLIDTVNGVVPIEEIRIGDLVKSFSYDGSLTFNKVTHTFFHPNEPISIVKIWGKELHVTSNHWFRTDSNTFKEIRHFVAEESLCGEGDQRYPVETIDLDLYLGDTYNFTVENDHTYIANGIYVHNKGSGKGGSNSGGSEADDTLFSTDLLYVLTALGEGPIYRVNPNGPQDIEINEGPIDDLLNIDGDGLLNANLFYYSYTTGTLNQAPMKVFGDSIISPQSLNNPVTLQKGDKAGVAPGRVLFMSTSTGTPWEQLDFKFNISSLLVMDSNGNINGNSVSVNVLLYDSTGQNLIVQVNRTISGKTSSSYKFDVSIIIPEDKISTSGYRFSIFKQDNDPQSSKNQSGVAFYGWDEILYGERAYPRTALVGYVISATSQYKGSVPTVTSMVKGLLCRVPSNYNQPMLESGEIDWRQVEVSDNQRSDYGYYMQKTGTSIQTDVAPIIYDGLWDGTFVYNWTQNPVWVVFEILTNKTWGLGIPLENIDKYNFYKIAQYADAVDQKTGRFSGVSATADGTYRYKPRGTNTGVREILLGLPNGSPIKERRFVFDAIISSRKQIMDTLNQICAVFRGILFYSAGKLTLNVDMPDDLPMAVFNETNIIDGSLMLSGTRESDIITGVDITFIDPLNHYKRETMRISDDSILREVNSIENIKAVDLVGCTRRSIAVRYAQYLMASGKYLRRKAEFKTSIEAIHLTIGDIISLSTRVTGTSWGNAGRVLSNASIGSSNVYLEHFTSPGLTDTIFQANTKPLALRIMQQDSDRVDYYLISNTNFTLQNTGNVISGYDSARISILSRFNPTTKSWIAGPYTFQANTVPTRFDLWTLGEVDPGNIFTSQTDKLFKVTQLQRNDEHDITINAVEYISNVYVDSETQIAYTPVQYVDLSSSLVPPPAPLLDLEARTVRNPDGSITYAIDINSSTDTTGYPIALQTQFEISYPDELTDIIGIMPTGFEPETLAFFDAVALNGAGSSSDRRIHVNSLITNLKSAGYWDILDDIWLYAGENEIQSLTSLKQRRLSTLFSPSIDTLPVFVPNFGFETNGANNGIDTNFIPLSHATIATGTNQMVSLVETNPVSHIGYNFGGRNNASTQVLLRTRSGSSITAALGTAGTSNTLPVSNGYGFVGSVRYSNNSFYVAKYNPDNTSDWLLLSGTPTSNSLTARSFYIGGFNNNNTFSSPRPTLLPFISYGSSITYEQTTEYYGIIKSYLAKIGVAI